MMEGFQIFPKFRKVVHLKMSKELVALVLAVVMLGSVAVLVGCNGGGSVTEADVVGSWSWVEAPMYLYTFNADGTGTRGVEGIEVESFTWSIRGGDRLNINRDEAPAGELANEEWNINIEGDNLTIDSRQVPGLEFTYVRVD